MNENTRERIVEVFWVAVKAAVVTIIILLLLRILPITIEHNGDVRTFDGSYRRAPVRRG